MKRGIGLFFGIIIRVFTLLLGWVDQVIEALSFEMTTTSIYASKR